MYGLSHGNLIYKQVMPNMASLYSFSPLNHTSIFVRKDIVMHNLNHSLPFIVAQ